MKIGDRVGVILGSNEDGSVDFFGYGIYEGDFVPLEAAGFLAEASREVNHTNPRMKLDNGGAVYGCECWWGAEETTKKILEGKTVNVVSIDSVREKYREE